jgi:hypothetical protein
MGVRRIGAITLAAMLAVGLAACGDDGGDGDGDDVALEDVDGSGTEDTDGSEEETDDTAAEEGSDDDVDLGAFGSDECQDLIGALGGIGGLFSGDSDELDFGAFADAFEEIDAPEIEEDLQVLAEAYREIDEAIGDLDLTDPEAFTSPEFQELALTLDNEQFTEASENVSAFMEDACGGG